VLLPKESKPFPCLVGASLLLYGNSDYMDNPMLSRMEINEGGSVNQLVSFCCGV